MRNAKVKWLVKIAVLAALSLALMYVVRFPFPAAPYLEYDMADVPILIGTFLFGPVSGLVLTFIVSLLQWLTVSVQSGWVGAVMHFFATGAFVLVAGLIYKKIHSLKGALLGLVCGSLVMIALMIPLNLFFTVHYNGMAAEAVQAMIWPVIVPFNALKAGINSLVTFLAYKPISRLFKVQERRPEPVR